MGRGSGWERFLQEYVSDCAIRPKHILALRGQDDKILSHHDTEQHHGDTDSANQEYVTDCAIRLKQILTLRSRDDKILSHHDTEQQHGDTNSANDMHTICGPERNRRRLYDIINGHDQTILNTDTTQLDQANPNVLKTPHSIVTYTAVPAIVGTMVKDMWPESININYLDPCVKEDRTTEEFN
jgi:hypothetical protein